MTHFTITLCFLAHVSGENVILFISSVDSTKTLGTDDLCAITVAHVVRAMIYEKIMCGKIVSTFISISTAKITQNIP